MAELPFRLVGMTYEELMNNLYIQDDERIPAESDVESIPSDGNSEILEDELVDDFLENDVPE